MKNYTIAIDVMGGDYGPEAAIPAALMALQQHENLSLLLVGDEGLINRHLEAMLVQPQTRYRICHASQRIEMDEAPLTALRHKTDSSMRVALDLVKNQEAQACVSAGNTGALVTIARSVLKTLPGITRPAISALFPTMHKHKTVRMLDLGANADVHVENLLQFALMGLVLSTEVDKKSRPNLGLLNIGSEPGKGNHLLREAGTLFSSKAELLNYIGYLEGDMLFEGKADVIICDGFSGNIALKSMEGILKLIRSNIKQVFNQHGWSRLAGWIAKPFLSRVYDQLDPNRYNGASLVGLQGIVIKSHGHADAQAFNYAIQNALVEIDKEVPKKIKFSLEELLQHSFEG